MDEIVLACPLHSKSVTAAQLLHSGMRCWSHLNCLCIPLGAFLLELHFDNAILLPLSSCEELFDVEFPIIQDVDSNLFDENDVLVWMVVKV